MMQRYPFTAAAMATPIPKAFSQCIIIVFFGKVSINFLTEIPRSRLDDGVSRLEEAPLLGVLHGAEADAVLDAPAGVEKLALYH